MVIVRTSSGDEGFMAGHAWACKLLEVGELWIKEAGQSKFRGAAVAGGYIDVKDSIIVYTDAAEWQEDIDMQRAMEAKASAEDWLTHDEIKDPDELGRAQIALAKAITRMKVGKGGGRRG